MHMHSMDGEDGRTPDAIDTAVRRSNRRPPPRELCTAANRRRYCCHPAPLLAAPPSSYSGRGTPPVATPPRRPAVPRTTGRGVPRAGVRCHGPRAQAVPVHGEMGNFFPMRIARLRYAHLVD